MTLPRKSVLGISAFAMMVIVVALALFITNQVSAHDGDSNLIHACVNNSSGKVKLIAADDNCKKNLSPLDWNIQGIQGEPGTDGAKGDKGDTGNSGTRSWVGGAGIVTTTKALASERHRGSSRSSMSLETPHQTLPSTVAARQQQFELS